MGNSQKPRKRHIPKPVVKPLGMRSAIDFEMPVYQAIEALGQPHFCEQHVYNLLSNVDMVRRIAPNGDPILPVVYGMVFALAEIQHRAQHMGKMDATDDEIKVLREGVGETMRYLQRAPNVAIDRAARAAVREFDRTGVLRV